MTHRDAGVFQVLTLIRDTQIRTAGRLTDWTVDPRSSLGCIDAACYAPPTVIHSYSVESSGSTLYSHQSASSITAMCCSVC